MLTLEHKSASTPVRSALTRVPRGAVAAPPAAAPLVQRRASCACGGSCPRCQTQSALPISEPDDRFEREADAVADRVMRMADPEPMAQRKVDPVAAVRATQRSTGHAGVDQALNSPGEPLPPDTRVFFESRFGIDLSSVRVHTDAAAERSARELSALAYTVGPEIVFARGQFSPATNDGRRLLAHELAHVVQQGVAPDAEPIAPTRRSGHDDYAHGACLASSGQQPLDLALTRPPSARLQRYATNQNCSGDARSIIARGFKLANWATKRAASLLEAGAPSDGLAAWFDFLFGDQAAAKRGQIAANFRVLNDAMQEDYEFICPAAGTKPCIGAQAEVDEDRNVKICMDKISAFSPAGVARLLVHENVRRAQGRRNVTNINDATGECIGAGGSKRYAEATTDANHPIPYSCFAEKLITIYLAERENQVYALIHNLYGSSLGWSYWHGSISINGKIASIDVSLSTRLIEFDHFLFGNYSYRNSEGRLVAGTIPFGLIHFIDSSGRPEALMINFEWEEGEARGRGRWLSSSATTLAGTWGRGDSYSNGGIWTIMVNRSETK